jgi:hypothetical protein
MSEQTFKSPNFYEREIDLSAPATSGPTGVPALIIGTANKGPAFVPVTAANFNEYTEVFGNLDPDKFGPYAANEFLKNRSSLSYIRILGAGANSTTAHIANTTSYGVVEKAGFALAGTSTTDNRHVGAVQFLVARHDIGTYEGAASPLFSDNDTFAGSTYVNLVRGLIMTPNTSRIMVTASHGSIEASSFAVATAINDDADLISGKFKLIISSSLGASFAVTDGIAGIKVLTASFDPSDSDYVGKILNRDPDMFYQDQHYLHADFAVDKSIVFASGSAQSRVGILSGSANTSVSGDASKTFREVFGSYNTRFTAPKTTTFISQPFGKTEYDLFHIESIDDGEYANQLYKISISNLKASTNDADRYGTFTVQIRNWDDTDQSPQIIEQFSNCSLNPDAQNYVAKLIGDRKVQFSFDSVLPGERRSIATGKYPNRSRYVRLVMNALVDNKQIPETSLPFGFKGIHALNVNPNLVSSTALSSANARLGGKLNTSFANLSSSYIPPVPMRFKVTRGEVPTSPAFIGEPGNSEVTMPSLYWGVKFERSSTSSSPTDTTLLNPNVVQEKNELLASLTKFVGIEKLDALMTGSNADLLNNNKFSLSKVVLYNDAIGDLTSSVNSHIKEAAYIRNAVLDSTKYTYAESNRNRMTLATILSSGSASDFNRFSTFTKFTNFMCGGFDGSNFLERNARRFNDKSVSFDSGGGASPSNSIPGFATNPSGQDVNNNGVASYMIAINIATDPLIANNNILAIPGIREPYINDSAMAKVKDYGLALHVMDIPTYDDSGNRLYDDSVAKPNIGYVCNELDARSIDNNYVATYFPDIFIDDATNRRRVKVPASIAALGALGFNDRVSYPWFAPAGFNRAALDFVTNVAVRLNVSDRDRLYESRINPIATFPRLGFVVYGQKTLQINKSALDRVNVRRLMLEIKRVIINIAKRIVFEQNTTAVRNKFVADTSFQLGLIQVQAGIEGFQVVMNETNNTQEDVDLNRLNGRIVVIPTRVVEFIAIDFIVTNSGVQFV